MAGVMERFTWRRVNMDTEISPPLVDPENLYMGRADKGDGPAIIVIRRKQVASPTGPDYRYSYTVNSEPYLPEDPFEFRIRVMQMRPYNRGDWWSAE